MGGAARRQHQHAFVPQRPDRLAQRQMGGGTAVAQDRQLRHRDVSFRVHQRERDPGAVVQSAPGIAPDGPAHFGLHQFSRTLRQFRRAGSGIAHPVKLGGKARKS